MREIKLTQGKIAIVDDEDYDYLNQWKWHANNSYKTLWYALRKDNTNKNIQMHRIIMNAPPNMKVDHIDGDGLNNQKYNLRVCEHIQNCANRGKQSNNTSGYKGVTWYEPNNKWLSKIRVNGKTIYLGYFPDPLDAAKAYDIASKTYNGKFGYLNFPD